MPREVRFTVRMSSEEHDLLSGAAKAQQRDKADLVRWLIRIAGNVAHVGECSSIVHQSCTNEASVVRQLEDYGKDIAPLDHASTARKIPEEEKEKKKREERGLAPLAVSKEILDYLNEMAGTDVRHKAKSHRQLIQARLNDGATVEDFKTVIRKKCKEWLGSKMQTNLKPATLFAACHFDDYLGQLEPVKSYPKQSVTQKQAGQQNFTLTEQQKKDGWV